MLKVVLIKMFKVAPLQRSDCDCSPRVLWTTSQRVLQSRETGDRWLTCGQSTSLLADESWPRLNFSHSADVNSQRNMYALLSTPRPFSFVNITLAGTSAEDEKLLTALKASQLPYNFCSNTHSICRSPELTRWKIKDSNVPRMICFCVFKMKVDGHKCGHEGFVSPSSRWTHDAAAQYCFCTSVLKTVWI